MKVDVAKLPRLFKYVVSGGTASLVHLLIFSVATRVVHVPPLAASAVGFGAAVVVNYLLQYHWTFNHQGSHVTAFGRYISVTLLSFAINLLAFKLLIDHVDVDPLLAQAITIVIVFAVNFGLNSSYSFAAPKSGAD